MSEHCENSVDWTRLFLSFSSRCRSLFDCLCCSVVFPRVSACVRLGVWLIPWSRFCSFVSAGECSARSLTSVVQGENKKPGVARSSTSVCCLRTM